MTTYSGEIASNQRDQNGQQVSDAALQQLARQTKDTPVHLDFQGDAIGIAFWGGVEDGKVRALIHSMADLSGLFATPQFSYDPDKQVCNEDGSVRVYQNVRLMALGLTRSPADPNLTPLAVVPEKPAEGD